MEELRGQGRGRGTAGPGKAGPGKARRGKARLGFIIQIIQQGGARRGGAGQGKGCGLRFRNLAALSLHYQEKHS